MWRAMSALPEVSFRKANPTRVLAAVTKELTQRTRWKQEVEGRKKGLPLRFAKSRIPHHVLDRLNLIMI